MGKDKITHDYKHLIERAVDRAVYVTGYPVTGEVLKAINVTRAQAKKLVNDGILTSVDMSISGQLIKGYYVTGGVYPHKMLSYAKEQAKLAKEIEEKEREHNTEEAEAAHVEDMREVKEAQE